MRIRAKKMKTKRTVKLAIIRGPGVRKCPFGLPIMDACKNAGSSIDRMAPLDAAENDEDEEASISKGNRLVYVYYKTGEDCMYADKVIEDFGKVDCDYGDTGQGEKSVPLRGSPLYPSTFHGIGYDGMYGYPLGFYGDNNESRNLFFGLFSMLGHHSVDDMIKLANEFDESNEDSKANILDNLLGKLEGMREKSPEEFASLEKHLAEIRNKFDSTRVDNGIMFQLMKSWFGPRQVNY